MPAREGHKLKRLPRGVREELEKRLVEGDFTDYRGLAKWLGERGCEISIRAVRDYGAQLERRLELVRLATAQARAVVEASPDDDLKVHEVMLRLVQQNLFAVLVELEPDDLKGANLHAVARTVAHMGRAVISHRQYAEHLRRITQRATAAGEEVVQTVRTAGGGLSPQAEEDIRRVLLTITQ